MTMYERIKNMTEEEMQHFVYWVYENGNKDGQENCEDSFGCSYFGGYMLGLQVEEVMPNNNVKEDLWNQFDELYYKK